MTNDQLPAETARGALNLSSCVLWLTVAMGGVLPLAAGGAYALYGRNGLAAAGVAFAVCWVAGVLALAITRFSRDPQRAMAGLVLAMLVRMGLPLAAGLTLGRGGGPLAEGGVFGLIVLFFLVMLTVETFLSVRLVNSKTSKAS